MLVKSRLGQIKNTEDLLVLVKSLEIVKKKGNEHWNTIDILASVAQDTVGFIIGENNIDCLTFYPKVENNTNIMWIWTASAEGSNPFIEYMDDIKTLATSINCTEIHWSSKRKGYMKKLPQLGADVHQVEYKIII